MIVRPEARMQHYKHWRINLKNKKKTKKQKNSGRQMEMGLKIRGGKRTVYKKYNYFLITRISGYVFMMKTKPRAF